jgi:hypothetical protein
LGFSPSFSGSLLVSLVLCVLAKGLWPFASVENPKICGANSSQSEEDNPQLRLAIRVSGLFVKHNFIMLKTI